MMFKTIFYFFIFLLYFQCDVANSSSNSNDLSASQSIDKHRMTYDIFSEKKKIGEMTHRIIPTDQGYTIAETSQINISGWWGEINLRSNFIETYDNTGRLLGSDNKIRDGKTTHHLRTHLNHNDYLAFYRKIKNTTKDEQSELNLLDSLINQSASINMDALLNLSHTIFSNRTEKIKSDKFSTNDFDTTSTYLPFFLQKNTKEIIKNKIKLYDPEELKITYQQIEDLGWEEMTLNKESIKTRHFTLTDDKNPPTHLWIGGFSEFDTESNQSKNRMKESIPYLVRLTAEDKDGPIEIVLK